MSSEKKLSARERSGSRRVESGSALSRRSFMTAGAGAAAALAAPATEVAESYGETCPAELCGSATRWTWPSVVCARDGVLEAHLEVHLKQVPVPGHPEVLEWVRLYNDDYPGPTLHCRPGDRLRIHLTNSLPRCGDRPADGAADAGSTPHGFNTTNLHYHGLHVSPEYPSDDVLVQVEPGECAEYCVQIPKDHAPGTHWYHAHKHGSTALQVTNGMAGALIIEEPASDRVAPAARDRVWVVQETIGDTEKYPDLPRIYTCYPLGVHFSVNGRYQPTFTLRAGQVERWRIINAAATPRALMTLKLVRCNADLPDCDDVQPVYLIAVDGISLYGRTLGDVRVTERFMSPGNRIDLLVQVLEPGQYALVPFIAATGDPQGPHKLRPQVLAFVNVLPADGGPRPEPLDPSAVIPGSYPRYLEPFDEAERAAATEGPYVELQICQRGDTDNADKPYCHDQEDLDRAFSCVVINPETNNPVILPDPPPFYIRRTGAPITSRFLINGEVYDPDAIDISVPLGAVMRWSLGNASTAIHPFHIHVNPFYVEDSQLGWIWMDTYGLPPSSTARKYTEDSGPPTDVYFRFYDFTGIFVLHCHILIHEDLGMMMNVEVAGDGIGPCAPGSPLPYPCVKKAEKPTRVPRWNERRSRRWGGK